STYLIGGSPAAQRRGAMSALGRLKCPSAGRRPAYRPEFEICAAAESRSLRQILASIFAPGSHEQPDLQGFLSYHDLANVAKTHTVILRLGSHDRHLDQECRIRRTFHLQGNLCDHIRCRRETVLVGIMLFGK